MAKKLVVIKGPDQGKLFPITADCNSLLGRGRHADSRLTDGRVSRVHCEVELLKSGRVLLTDLESTGTFVNGQRIAEQFLKVGDVIKIGDSELRLEDTDAVEDATLPPLAPMRPVLLTTERLHQLTGARLSHYDIGDLLARGQSGLVFKANDFKNERAVAFKVLWPEFSRDDEEMRRFVRAMKTMLPLRHPNLVSLYGAGKTGPYCWIAMEYVAGESLTQVIQRLGTAGMLDWRKVLRIAVGLSRALEYAHGQNIIHRNITPNNVLIGENVEETKLGDLMLAKALEGNLAQQITKPGEILGDVRFMAPERTGGNAAAVDCRSDLYSLGALLYVLLAGRAPCEGKNLIESLTAIRQTEPTRPKKFQLAIPDLFEGTVLRMLAKRPEDRFQTAPEVLRELERVAKFQGVKL